MPPSRRGPVTATELHKELEDRYRNDPAYKASVDRQEAEHRARHEELRRAERPLVSALQSAGIPVDSVWELYEYPELGETAYPLLREHLDRDYPDRILDGIARAFTKDVARTHWQDLLGIYLSDGRPEVRDGLAATLSDCAVRTHFDDLIAIVENQALGESRIYFLRPVNRIGNRMSAGGGRKVIERFANDPQLGTEANAILKGRGRND
ncbi:hypothetical protein P0Y31_14625 [Knoellia sp. 3-2P3]|uniref:hypothetical protein n=1 Tax=unclassified Knoellia TaxID=2618719 RepID=UPI0023DA9B35|nr:hypothetical protein [Knoellia sp. 3-2P3]MDF2093585.1 hypothetical protein [Knoellia sp. 3-2P3]